MDKLKMHTPNKVDENFQKLAALFPNAVTETIDPTTGEVVRAIDKDVLMQEISTTVVEGKDERYQFTWPDKKKSILLANSPISKTLRPCREESVDFDNTENLYIEGDNLDVLKLLQETYLGKIKMIYIDPPYNTGNDFVYNDDFAESTEEYLANSGQFDEEGNRLVQNTESNGRFHTDWLNMIYPRLKLAKDLLREDGVIFISIDDNEVDNLKKICDEIFGAFNCIGPIIQNKQNAKNDTINVQKNHEFILIYRKQAIFNGTTIKPTLVRKVVAYKDAYEENGEYYYLNDPITTRGEGGTLNARPNLGYTVYYNPINQDKVAVVDYDVSLARYSNEMSEIYTDDKNLIQLGYTPIRPPKVRGKLGCWTWSLEKFNNEKKSIIITGKPDSYSVRKRTFVSKDDVVTINGKLRYEAKSLANSRSILDFSTNEGTNVLNGIMDGSFFNNPKNLEMIKYLLNLAVDKDDIILDFFSGSATTAHAVMKLNATDGGKRKFIMVQLPEETDEKSEAYKAGYKNICEIGKERIRRAGVEVKHTKNEFVITHKITPDTSEKAESDFQFEKSFHENYKGSLKLNMKKLSPDTVDIGFRVLKLDSTNMKDVYYNPADFEATLLDTLDDNIKEDRTPEDLLFQVMLDLGILLSEKIEEKIIDGKKVFIVGEYDVESTIYPMLIACFDENVTNETVTAIVKHKPYYFVMRDSSMATDSVATNFEQIFATYSADTVRKVL